MKSKRSPELSPRQTQVIRMICRGLANKEIASELDITVDTVERHISAIFVRLGAVNRAQAAFRWANR